MVSNIYTKSEIKNMLNVDNCVNNAWAAHFNVPFLFDEEASFYKNVWLHLLFHVWEPELHRPDAYQTKLKTVTKPQVPSDNSMKL